MELRCQSRVAVSKQFCTQQKVAGVRAGCKLRAHMLFGLTFTDVCGQCHARVSYFKWLEAIGEFGATPSLRLLVAFGVVAGNLKDGLRTFIPHQDLRFRT